MPCKRGCYLFVKETENVNFIEAVEILAKEAGLQIPEQDPQAKEKSSYRDELFKIMELVGEVLSAFTKFGKRLKSP